MLPYEAEGLCECSNFLAFSPGFLALPAPLALVPPGTAVYTFGTGCCEVSLGVSLITCMFPCRALFLSGPDGVGAMGGLLTGPAGG